MDSNGHNKKVTPINILSMRTAGKFARKMSINNGDILIVKAGTPIATLDNIDVISKALGKVGKTDVVVIVVDSFDDLKTLDRKKMAEHGWFRLNRSASDIMKRLSKLDEGEDNGDNESE